jgi:hypothetical protein
MNIIKKIIAYFRIPRGDYCYTFKRIIDSDDFKNNPPKRITKCCPYWDKLEGYNDQESGYCHYLGYGDMDINNDENRVFTDMRTGEESSAPEMPFGVGLLWDQCKECGIKPHWEDVWRNLFFKWEKLIKPKNKYGLIKLSKKRIKEIFLEDNTENPFLLVSSFKHEFYETWNVFSDESKIKEFVQSPLLDEARLFFLKQDMEEQISEGGVVIVSKDIKI